MKRAIGYIYYLILFHVYPCSQKSHVPNTLLYLRNVKIFGHYSGHKLLYTHFIIFYFHYCFKILVLMMEYISAAKWFESIFVKILRYFDGLLPVFLFRLLLFLMHAQAVCIQT